MVQEAFGATAHLADLCCRLADEGWFAVAPHLYHRTGDPDLPYGNFNAVRPHLSKLRVATIDEDLDVAFGALLDAGIDPEHSAIVGFCMGGTVAMATAASRVLGASVTFYGSGVLKGRFGYEPLIELAPRLVTPWLGLYGDLDRSIPSEQVESLRTAASTASVATEVIRYPKAGHGFNCDRRSDYHERSATDAWARMLAWFDAHASGGGKT